jgi:large subunit ribosomal protein L10
MAGTQTLSVKRQAKNGTVAELVEEFKSSQATVLTEYRGLSVSQLTQLRRSLGSETTYAVAKNTLTKIAAAEAGVAGLDELLVGPTAVAFIKGDPVEAAKGLRAFTKENPALIVKGGTMEGRPLSAGEIGKLADLESREVLLAMLAGAMKAGMAKAAATIAAPTTQFARLAQALADKKAAEAA